MSQDPKRSPAEAWEALEKAALKQEGERVEALSDEALDASLAARGIDPKAARERGAALAAKLLAQRTPPNVVSIAPERARRKRSVTWIALVAAAAAALVLGGGGAAVVAWLTPAPSPGPSVPAPTAPPTPPAPPPEAVAKQEAEDLRKLALSDCNADKWDECLARLGKAEELDPAGDHARSVVRLRAKARRGRLADSVMLKAFPNHEPRSLTGAETDALATALRASAGQNVQIVCAPGAEPGHVCDQLASTLAKAGWVVSRSKPAAGEGAPRGIGIDVATDTDDATQAAADALADALAVLSARGPDDMPPAASSAPLRITVGAK